MQGTAARHVGPKVAAKKLQNIRPKKRCQVNEPPTHVGKRSVLVNIRTAFISNKTEPYTTRG